MNLAATLGTGLQMVPVMERTAEERSHMRKNWGINLHSTNQQTRTKDFGRGTFCKMLNRRNARKSKIFTEDCCCLLGK